MERIPGKGNQENVDEMFTILPFETEFYKKHGVDVNYVGNPLVDAVEKYHEDAVSKEEFLSKNNLDNRPIVALLAGSRKQEIENTLTCNEKSCCMLS
jgi:lipid-A-disaccharide synthase